MAAVYKRPFERIVALVLQLFTIGICTMGLTKFIVGRGVISILLGIFGIIYSFEGFWALQIRNVVKIRSYGMFLVVYSLSTLVVAIIEMLTIETYCAGVWGTDQQDECEKTGEWSAYLGFVYSLLLMPLAVTMGYFARACARFDTLQITHREYVGMKSSDNDKELM